MCRRVFPRCALYNGEKKIGVSNGTNKIIPRPNPWSCHRHWLCWNYERVRLHRQQAAKTCGWTWRVVEVGGLEHWLNPMIIAGTYPPISIDLGKDEPGMTLQLRWDPFRKLLSYRKKRPALNGSFLGGNIMISPKCPLHLLIDHSANPHWLSDLACPPSS